MVITLQTKQVMKAKLMKAANNDDWETTTDDETVEHEYI